MSAILGILNLDSGPLESGILETMKTPMSYWGPDGSGTWLEGAVGLAHLKCRTTPESVHETLPMKSVCGRWVITCRARIDNRGELLKVFDIPAGDSGATPDSHLILEAYIKWGQKCVDHLLGDWVFAVYDCRKKELFIARDHHGVTGLYYYHGTHRGRRFFAFSSGIKGLLALPEVPRRLNELHVAQALVSWHEHGPRTIYKDIFRLPPANFLTVTAENIKIQRYWVLEDSPRIRLKSDEEYVEAFLEIYGEAVHCRLRSEGNVGLTLSGGLDSGSVAALAAPELEQKGERLLAFTAEALHHVPAGMPKNRFYDPPLARATAEHIGNIDLTCIRAEHITPLQAIERGLDIHDEPIHAVSNLDWMFSLLEEAQNRGVSAMLTGAEGNFSISWQGRGYLAQLVRQFHWLTFYREFRRWRAVHAGSMLRMFKEQVLKPLVPLWARKKRREFKGRKQPWENYSAIHPTFARRIGLADEMLRTGHDPAFGMIGDTKKLRYKGIRPGRSMMGCLLQQNGAAFGMEIRDPTMDRRVLEFCLSIPDDQYLREGDRFLIRRAMKGLLPEEVLLNRKRGLQAPDAAARLRMCIQQAKEILEDIQTHSPHAQEYLDMKKMWAALNGLETDTDFRRTRRNSFILLRGLMTGLFLRRFETE